MVNVKELEKRWFRYKMRGFLSFFSLFALSSGLIYGTYYAVYKSNFDFLKKKQLPPPTPLYAKQTVIPKEAIIVQEDDDEVVLSPIIPIIDLENEEKTVNTKRKRYVRNKKRVRRATKERVVTAKKDRYLTANELQVIKGKNIKSKEVKKINLHGTTNNYMNIMKKKFQQHKNPRDALLIAKAYYKAGNYKNSEKWALIANNLDKKLDESWLLFASSQEKLGKRKEALKVLLTYYRATKSPKAKALIEKMRKEKSI